MMQYKVLKSIRMFDLALKINAHLVQGFVCAGGIAIYTDSKNCPVFVQAVVQYDDQMLKG